MTFIADLVPLTVLTAVFLFVLKEGLEWFKRLRGDKRKKQAFRLLLAEETERNHWALKRLRHCLEAIEGKKDHPDRSFRLELTKDGRARFAFDDSEGGAKWPMPQIYRDHYDRILTDVAILDAPLFRAMRIAYQHVAELVHIHGQIVYFLTSEDPLDKDHLEDLPEFAVPKIDEAYVQLNILYEICTGTKLEVHRLR